MIKTYEIHAFAALVPMASTAEQAALNENVKANGLRQPVVLWQGKIIDGRCRQIACKYANAQIMVTELDDNLTEEAVKITVKALNTRRNLTMTQKIISACKETLNSSHKLSITDTADSWGISDSILKNARYIATHAVYYIEPLFNGGSVTIMNATGEEVISNKVSAVYASLKRQQEQVSENIEHGWKEDSFINTQAGKDWYYITMRDQTYTREILAAKLANYRFPLTQDLDLSETV